jgi:hypothetical protein
MTFVFLALPKHVIRSLPAGWNRVGCRNDSFVAGVQDSSAQVEAGLFCATRNQNLVRLVFKAIIAQKLLLDSRLQLRRAVNSRVFRQAGLYGFDGRNFYVLRSIKIRFAGPETDDIAPLRA